MYPKSYTWGLAATLVTLGVLPQTTPPMIHLHVNTLTGPDRYTGIDQRQTPYDGSNLRRGIELKHIPRMFTPFLELSARHKLNQVCTRRGFTCKSTDSNYSFMPIN